MISALTFGVGMILGVMIVMFGVVLPVGMEVNRLRLLNAELKTNLERARNREY